MRKPPAPWAYMAMALVAMYWVACLYGWAALAAAKARQQYQAPYVPSYVVYTDDLEA